MTVIATARAAARRPRRRIVIVAVLLALLLGAAPGRSWSADEPPNWQVGISGYHSSGTYGLDSRTDITSVPLSIRRLFRDGDVTLVIPYLSVTSGHYSR